MYSQNTFIVIDVSKSEKTFGKIIEIINISDKVYFYVQIYNEITFDHHLHAYIVEHINTPEAYTLVAQETLPNIAPVLFVEKQLRSLIVTRYIL